MFRLLARWLQAAKANPGVPPATFAKDADFATLFQFHPLQLHRYLEEAWAVGGFVPAAVGTGVPDKAFLGDPAIVGTQALPSALRNSLRSGIGAPGGVTDEPFYQPNGLPPGLAVGQPWEHLIYAYLIENTRVVPIFQRVLEWYSAGERLEVPSIDTRRWLRITEELLSQNPPPFHISSVTSFGRPDLEASRRNAYWRLLGMDLNHGGPDGRPYPYSRGAGGNADFVPQWESLLQEVWQGYINRRNSSGENYSDPEAVANRAEALSQTLQVRRLRGNLAREEFFFTAMMSWFHLTLEYDTPVVVDLKALASSPAERLRKIGERVGISPHPKARNFFELAEPASSLLRFIELERFNQTNTAEVLYDLTPNNKIREDALVVINHWSSATGRDLKLRRPDERPARAPMRVSRAAAVPPPPRATGVFTVSREEEYAGNGHR